MFKKAEKMNMLDKDILKTLLAKDDISIYELNKTLGNKNYVTVLRHVHKMLDDSVLKLRSSRSKRNAELLEVTGKGIATLLLRGNLSKQELFQIDLKASKLDFPNLLHIERDLLAEVFVDSLVEIRPKVNLEFFDEEWFRHVWFEATGKAMVKAIKKHEKQFEEKGIW